MITAMTMESIQMACQQRYESNEKRIVAIVIARYDIFNCRQMIQENYNFSIINPKKYLNKTLIPSDTKFESFISNKP